MGADAGGALPLLCLTGPTASGKSAAAMALARRLPIEIVSVDSALVYRGMDIGTAKPSHDERAAVPHHLIDLIDPAESYSAARFVADAEAAIAGIRSRERVPLLVGGTMLYLKALRDGLDDMPSVDRSVREGIEREAANEGWDAMHRKLALVDPASAARLAPRKTSSARTASPRPMTLLSLEPSDRSVLHRTIATRFDAMLEGGLVDEVRTLKARGDLHDRMPSMRCVGYRQAWSYLEGDVDAATMREQAIAATRQLAKRQLTWLRSMPERIVIDSLSVDAGERFGALAMEALRSG